MLCCLLLWLLLFVPDTSSIRLRAAAYSWVPVDGRVSADMAQRQSSITTVLAMGTYHGRSSRERLHVLDKLSRNGSSTAVLEGGSSARLVGLFLNKLRLDCYVCSMHALYSG